MTSVPILGPDALTPINGDLTATQKVNAAALDTDLELLRSTIDALIEACDVRIRDDNKLVDAAVRLYNLDPEVVALLGSGAGNTGIVWQPKVKVACATTGNITLSGEQTIDDVLTSASRVMVMNQTDPSQNGWYDSNAGAWTRCADVATAAAIGYAMSYITGGTTFGDQTWIQTQAGAVIELGVTALVFARLPSCGAGGASNLVGGAGISVTTVGGVTTIALSSFSATLTGGSNVEIGSSVASVNLSWSYTDTIIAQVLTGTGVVVPALSDRAQTVTGPFTTDHTWGINGTKTGGAEHGIASTTLAFLHKRYWGVSSVAVALSSAEVIALASNGLVSSFAGSYGFTPTAQYLWMAWPTAFGTPTFYVNGLLNTAWTKFTITFTNASGNVSSYDLYRSNFLQNSPVTVVVV